MRALTAPCDEAHDQEDDDCADDGADDPSEVEDLRIADAEPDGEDQVAEGSAREANQKRDPP